MTTTPTQSGEDLSTGPTKSSEVKSSVGGDLIDLSFTDKNNAKPSMQLNLLGLKDTLEDLDDEDDEGTSLLSKPLEQAEELSVPVPEEKPSSSQGSSSSREDLLGSSYESDDSNVSSLDSLGDLKMGQVICIGDKKTGRIRYIGPADFAPGVWIGVELDTPSGEGFLKKTVRVLSKSRANS